MSDSNISLQAQAQAQAGVVTLGNNNVLTINPQFSATGFIGKTLSPRRAKKSAESMGIMTEAIVNSMSRFMKLSPSIYAERAYLMAITGLQFTERQTENVIDVFVKASRQVDENTNPDCLSDMVKDKIVAGSKEADDDNVRELWAKLMIAEIKQPGTFSKRTLSILTEMIHDDAIAFTKLCSTSIYFEGKNRRQLIVVLTNTESEGAYNHGLITTDELEILSSYGLISTLTHYTHTIPAHASAFFVTQDQSGCIRNFNNGDISFSLSSIRFSREGVELSSLCQIGTYSNLKQVLKERLAISKLELEWDD